MVPIITRNRRSTSNFISTKRCCQQGNKGDNEVNQEEKNEKRKGEKNVKCQKCPICNTNVERRKRDGWLVSRVLLSKYLTRICHLNLFLFFALLMANYQLELISLLMNFERKIECASLSFKVRGLSNLTKKNIRNKKAKYKITLIYIYMCVKYMTLLLPILTSIDLHRLFLYFVNDSEDYIYIYILGEKRKNKIEKKKERGKSLYRNFSSQYMLLFSTKRFSLIKKITNSRSSSKSNVKLILMESVCYIPVRTKKKKKERQIYFYCLCSVEATLVAAAVTSGKKFCPSYSFDD